MRWSLQYLSDLSEFSAFDVVSGGPAGHETIATQILKRRIRFFRKAYPSFLAACRDLYGDLELVG